MSQYSAQALVFLTLIILNISSVWALTLTGVNIEPRAFDPARNQSSQIRFKLDQPARVTLRFYDLYERMVRTVESAGVLKPGEHRFSWDGRDQAGRLVAPEAYHYTLEAQTREGATVIHDLTDITGGDELTVSDVHWDQESGQANYTLTKPARVSLRAGISNYGPLLSTLLDWVPRKAGRYSLAWDGWDASRVLNVATHPKLELRASAFKLPRNTVFILPLSNEIAEPIEMPWKEQRRQPSHPTPTQARDYARQPAEERRDVALSLGLVNDYPQDTAGVPLVAGQVPIRIDVAEARHAALFKQRFEPVFFIDGIFLSEIEVGFLPTTYLWDSREYNPGIHYLTVNIVGFEGSMGSATLKLKIEDR